MWHTLKTAFFRSTETVVALILVLLFFMGFLAILSLSFPKGASLQDLILSREWSAEPGGAGGIELRLGEEEEAPGIVAMLARTHRNVKSKPADAIAWRSAQSGIALENRHSIQTLSKSTARISFGAGNDLDLGSNSLIVIRGSKRDDRGTPVTSSVLLEGALQGRIEESSGSAATVEVVTATGATLRVAAGTRDSDYRITMNPDMTSTFSMYDGEASVSSAGQTVMLRSRQTLTVETDQPPGLPVALPDAPQVLEPADGQVRVFRANPPRIRFEWAGPRGAEAYHLQIARDPAFDELVHEARSEETDFTHGNLDAGTYYWRVASLAGWAEGPEAPVRRLQLVQDIEPPQLEVTFPDGTVRGGTVMLEGVAEPGSAVYVGQSRVSLGQSGAFAYDLTLQPGLNVVVVEALDGAGNVAYQSRMVTAKF